MVGVSVSTHVLDAATGTPAAGVAVSLTDAAGSPCGTGTTDTDGRVGAVAADLDAGTYRLRFATGEYFADRGVTAFWPEVELAFTVTATDTHLHVPLLLSPFAYSTYRGS